MSISTPAVAVVNLPALLGALTRSGFDTLTGSVTSKDVAAACRDADREVVIVAAGLDQITTQWVDFQVRSLGRKVLVLYSDELPVDVKLPELVRTLPLPSSIDQIMAVFGAPPVGGSGGSQVIGEDGDLDEFGILEDPFLAVVVAPAATLPMVQAVVAPVPVPEVVASVVVPVATVPVPEVPVFPQASDPHEIPTPVSPRRLAHAFTAVPAPPRVVDSFDRAPVVVQVPQPVFQPVVPQHVPQQVVAPVVSPRVFQPVAQQAPQAFPQGPPPPMPAPQMFPLDVAPQTPFAPHPASHMPGSGRQCPVIFVVSAKGGVGKTTISACLAQHGAENGLTRTALIDMNRGQGDVRKYLRVSDLNGLVPTIYDAALAASPTGVGFGNPQGAIIRPKIINEHRNGLQPVSFGAVFAPRDGQADPAIVTTDFYAETIRAARSTADLVIVDTQIVESYDLSEMFTRIVVPLLASDPQAWCVSVTGPAMPGVHSMLQRWETWAQHNVPRDRLMFFFNRWQDGSTLNRDAVAEKVEKYASFLGAVPDDPTVFAAMSQGKIPNNVPSLGTILDQVLSMVTGLPAFTTDRYCKQKTSFMARLVGGRR